MASPSSVLSEEQFQCSICLDTFTSPVSTPCGHNYCLACIGGYWDSSDVCQCPLCKETFYRRPDLRVNRSLAEITEQFKKTRVSSDEGLCAKPGEVSCDFCTGRKLKAVKSCLVCLASYCETHIQPHYQGAAFRRHRLIEPVMSLEDRLCEKHERLLELFCRTDQTCVCVLCTESDHRTHNIVPLEQECRKKKTRLKKTGAEVQQMIQDRLKKVEEIKQAVELSKSCAQREIGDSVQVFTALRNSIERSQAELIKLIEEKQRAAERRAEGIIKELEQEITELKRRNTELEQLSHTEDHIQFLQSFPSLCSPPHSKDWSDIPVHPDLCLGALSKAVCQLEDRISEEMEKVPGVKFERLRKHTGESVVTDRNLSFTKVTAGSQAGSMKLLSRAPVLSFRMLLPRTVGQCLLAHGESLVSLLYLHVDVTLDPSTASPWLILSEDGKQVRLGDTPQDLPDNPQRFDYVVSVLGKNGITSGRHYWEVEVGEKTEWDLGVARESINRKGQNTYTSQDGYWVLYLRNGNEYEANSVLLPLSQKPQKVGVYVDYEGGQVSFYNVDNRSHIYTFTASFTEKLFPYLSPCNDDGGTNPAPLIICPVSESTGHSSSQTGSRSLRKCPGPDCAVSRMRTGHSEWLCLIILLVQQISVSRPETFQVLGPADPVVAVAGEDTVLPCYLSPRISAEGLEIRWYRDERSEPVFLYRKQRPELQDQVLTYRGRAALFLEELSKGNTSLQLTRVRGSDHGRYRCVVESLDWYDDTVFEVDVRAVGTQAAISLETHQAQGVRLGCESKGWFPEPEVVWLDSEGQSLTADPTETHRDSQDLFTVRRQVTVQHSATNRFTCRVEQQQLNQVREAEIDVPSELFPRVSPWMVAFWVILVLVLCALVGLAMIMYRHVKLRTERDWLREDREKCRPGEFERLRKHAADVTLDPNTAHPDLILSEDGKQVRDGNTRQDLPDNPERFDTVVCVLGKDGITSGRHYWEVEVGEKTDWDLGVARESINRKENKPLSPEDGYWTVWLRNGNEYEALDDSSVLLPLSQKPQKVGVYVDYEGGQVSFYNVDNRSHIYTFTASFTEKLFPYFSPGLHQGGTNSAPLIICPVSHTD
ncbi:uncharacterized protein [Lepisosteus oculatus]|uniref:uncharacterized protein n=1 Tax=Lepisosteus oculatus TaxID=7918 RepID=UPI00371F9F9B